MFEEDSTAIPNQRRPISYLIRLHRNCENNFSAAQNKERKNLFSPVRALTALEKLHNLWHRKGKLTLEMFENVCRARYRTYLNPSRKDLYLLTG